MGLVERPEGLRGHRGVPVELGWSCFPWKGPPHLGMGEREMGKGLEIREWAGITTRPLLLPPVLALPRFSVAFTPFVGPETPSKSLGKPQTPRDPRGPPENPTTLGHFPSPAWKKTSFIAGDGGFPFPDGTGSTLWKTFWERGSPGVLVAPSLPPPPFHKPQNPTAHPAAPKFRQL